MAKSKKNSKPKARFVINMNTGAHGPRTAETDALPLTFRLITDETCKDLATGKVTGMQVIEAIKRIMMSAPTFSWEEYDRRRQAEKMRMNVSQHEMVPVAADGDKKPDEPSVDEDVYSLERLGIGPDVAAARAAEDSKNRKIEEALAGI